MKTTLLDDAPATTAYGGAHSPTPSGASSPDLNGGACDLAAVQPGVYRPGAAAALLRVPSPLSLPEQVTLAHCEETIRAYLETFYQVGAALAQIRDQKLYRAAYCTFDQYCRERWAMVGRRAYQFIAAATVFSAISAQNGVNHGSHLVLPATESQVRPLAGLHPDEQIAAWQEAVEIAPEGRVTRKLVEEVVQRRQGKSPAVPPPAIDVPNQDTKAERVSAATDATIAQIRELINLTGTADSIPAAKLWDALEVVQGFKVHTEKMEVRKQA